MWGQFKPLPLRSRYKPCALGQCGPGVWGQFKPLPLRSRYKPCALGQCGPGVWGQFKPLPLRSRYKPCALGQCGPGVWGQLALIGFELAFKASDPIIPCTLSPFWQWYPFLTLKLCPPYL